MLGKPLILTLLPTRLINSIKHEHSLTLAKMNVLTLSTVLRPRNVTSFYVYFNVNVNRSIIIEVYRFMMGFIHVTFPRIYM